MLLLLFIQVFFFVNTRVRKTFVIIFGWLFINLYFLAYSYVRVDSFMLVCTTLYSWTEKNVYVSYVFENIVVTLCNIPIWQVIGLILLKRARDNFLKKKKTCTNWHIILLHMCRSACIEFSTKGQKLLHWSREIM